MTLAGIPHIKLPGPKHLTIFEEVHHILANCPKGANFDQSNP